MPTPVIMPKMEMSQETATLIDWLVEEGQQVEKGQPIFEVETDKVTVEVESPAAGLLSGLSAKPGDVIPVTTILAYILAEGERLPVVEPVATNHQTPSTPDVVSAVYAVTPVARRLADDLGVDLSSVVGTGPGDRISKGDVETASQSVSPKIDKVRATPAARLVARDVGIELSAVVGSGPRGRVQEGDVARWRGDAIPTDLSDSRSADVVPLAGMRRTIAKRMTQSWQTAPHVTFTVEVNMSAALVLRTELNERAEREGLPKISVTALLVKICAWALKRHPFVNATLAGEDIHLQPDANIGVAVALESGLIVPVVKQADRLGLAAIAGNVSELTAKARAGGLEPEDVSGGTFTISNLGMFRIDHFTAIVNPPQAAILAVGRTAKRQIVIETEQGDEVAIRPIMSMTLSADHRVLDGAQAALFLNDLVEVLEQPSLALL